MILKTLPGLTLLLLILGIPMQSFGYTASPGEASDIYLVFYLSKDGRTGHLGMAVDNYDIFVRDVVIDGRETVVRDTVKNFSLTYFDLWGPSEMDIDDHNVNLACRYYTLPQSSAEPRITVGYFLTKGLPHSYDYPCDGLVRIRTSPSEDYAMIRLAEAMQEKYHYFNTRQYNCVDYIIRCLNTLFNVNIEAKEYIPFTWSSTPNKLYTSIGDYLDVEVVKEAGPDAQRSFFRERIFKSLFTKQHTNDEEIN